MLSIPRWAIRKRSLAVTLMLVALLPTSLALSAEPPGRVLRVSADPDNLPFSNARSEGFENKIAELIARELGATLEYVWWPQRRGSARDTLNSGLVDLIIGVPAGFERVATTRSYYASTYVFVYRRGALPVVSFDDPALRVLHVGVTMIGGDLSHTPPARALLARGYVENIRGYAIHGDHGTENPTDPQNPSAEIIRAVARGDIDVAIVWGPLAGYFGSRQSVPLEIAPVSPERDGPGLPFVFRIAMGVRKGNETLRRELDAILQRHRPEIDRILDDYGVPRVLSDGAVVTAGTASLPH